MIEPSYRLLRGFLKTFFHLLYHPFAWSYDLVAATVSVGMWKTWVMAVLPYLDGSPILELGHGPGHLQLALCQKGIQTTGLDRSPQMGRLAHRRLMRSGFQPRLINGQAQSLPFPSGHFRRIVATFPTEYILEAATLAEAWRVLAPGGELVLLPTAWITGRAWLHRAAAGLFRVTGQAPKFDENRFERALEPLRQAGFTATAEPIVLPNSVLLLVRARRPGSPPADGLA